MSSIDAIKNKVTPTAQQWQQYQLEDKIEPKFQELRADEKYKNWTDEELRDYAASMIANASLRTATLGRNSLLNQIGLPPNPDWAQYSYEEILQMQDGGVKIPDDVLDWAHSMQASNTVDYELDTGDGSDSNDSEMLLSGMNGMGESAKVKAAKSMNRKAILQEEAIAQAAQEFQKYSTELDVVADNAQAIQSQTLKKVEAMMAEFQAIDAKVKSGEQLTDGEKTRYGELGILVNNEVQRSSVQIEGFTSDFDEISKLMQQSSQKIQAGQNYADNTEFMGRLIAEPEAKHDRVAVRGNKRANDGSFGVVGRLKSAMLAKDFGSTSQETGFTLESIVLDSDKAIKKISEQMKTMTTDIETGDAEVETEVETTETTPEVGAVVDEKPVDEVEPPANDDNLEELPPATEGAEQENVFAEDEDINDIDTIVKRQQRQEPKTPSQEIV